MNHLCMICALKGHFVGKSPSQKTRSSTRCSPEAESLDRPNCTTGTPIDSSVPFSWSWALHLLIISERIKKHHRASQFWFYGLFQRLAFALEHHCPPPKITKTPFGSSSSHDLIFQSTIPEIQLQLRYPTKHPILVTTLGNPVAAVIRHL